jgi:ATP-dependent Clp protease ATP-binding subunit ClpC
MKAADRIARQHNLNNADTGHLLLGIFEIKDCLGAVILRNLKIDKEKVREVCEQLQKNPNVQVESQTVNDKQNLTDAAQKVIQCASEEAVRLGHEYVGAEHLLAGILLVGDGLGHRILTELGVTIDRVRRETAKLIVCRPVQTE